MVFLRKEQLFLDEWGCSFNEMKSKIGDSKRLSRMTLGLGAYIVISAAFMLQVRRWLFNTLGDFVVINCFRFCFILIFILTILYALRTQLNIFKIFAVLFIFILSYLLILWQPYFSEKTHVLTYGLLGYLSSRDLIGKPRALCFKNITLTVSFIALISAADEIFQVLLPYRYGDIRDFITNIISGASGTVLFFALNK